MGPDRAVGGFGLAGAFGGVLGDVAGEPLFADLPVVVLHIGRAEDRADVDLSAPDELEAAPSGRAVFTATAAAAARTDVSSRSGVAQAGGEVVAPSGPSRRTTAWKWTSPRRWYSATLPYETRATCRRSRGPGCRRGWRSRGVGG